MSTGRVGDGSLHRVTILATGACNLACDYCYQDPSPRLRRRMEWRVAQRALGRLLAAARPRATLEVSGGEPLLASPLVRRIIADARRRGGTPDRLDVILTTNGTLLTAELVAFLADRDVTLRISHDGVGGAQGARGEWTFAVLDCVLAEIRLLRPDYFARRVVVVMTVTASSVPHLAASLRYFVTRGVTQIDVGPRMTVDGDWLPESAGTLQGQVDEVVDTCLDLFRRERRCPVSFLQGADTAGAPSVPSCAGLSGRGLCVDPDGHCWACPVLSPPLSSLDPSISALLSVLDLGDLSDPALDARLDELPGRVRSLALGRRPSECAECRDLADCSVCPATLILNGRADDAPRIPELPCAFSRATLAARRRFRSVIGGAIATRLRDPHDQLRSALLALRGVVDTAAVTTVSPEAQLASQRRC